MTKDESFQNLISDPERFADLMKNNESSPKYEQWEQKRRFIAQLVDSDGTILDIGCAGGFFLRSLQEWSGRKLTPYGIDINIAYIAAAQELYPSLKNHFAVLDVRKVSKISDLGLPNNYTFVYWNFLGPKYFDDPKLKQTIQNIINLAEKRMIVGFYGANSSTDTTEKKQAERERIQNRMKEFQQDWPTSGSLFNPTGFNQGIVWIDK